MINKIIIDGENVELTEESQIPFTYTFSQAKTHTVKFGLDNTTEICAYAFQDCKNLTKITIPDEITMIKRGAFKNCSSLPEITIGKNIEYIGRDAFTGCTNLSSVTFENSTPPEVYCTLPSKTKIYVPNDSKFVPVDYDDLDMSNATKYYYKENWTSTRENQDGNYNVIDYQGYGELDDVTMADESTQYYQNQWDSIADNDHTTEVKNIVPISGIEFEYDNVAISQGDTFEFSYSLIPANATNEQIYWNIDNTNIVNIDTETGKKGVINLVASSEKYGSTTITAVGETTGASISGTITVKQKN